MRPSRLQVHVTGRGRAAGASQQVYIFELRLRVPRFAMFAPTTAEVQEPASFVSFTVKEQLTRLATWVESCFLVARSGGCEVEGQAVLPTSLMSTSVVDRGPAARDGLDVQLHLAAGRQGGERAAAEPVHPGQEEGGLPDTGQQPRHACSWCNSHTPTTTTVPRYSAVLCFVQIRVSDMELAGDLVQDLCRYLNLDELESTATFPEDMEQLKGVLMRVTDYNAQRMKMTADMADVSQRVKSLIVKAEDNRILGAMQVGCESPPQR
jgi:hypothetical protein